MRRFLIAFLLAASIGLAADIPKEAPKLSDSQKLAIRTAQFNNVVLSDKMRAVQVQAATLQKQLADAQAEWDSLVKEKIVSDKTLGDAISEQFKTIGIRVEDYDLDATLGLVAKSKSSGKGK